MRAGRGRLAATAVALFFAVARVGRLFFGGALVVSVVILVLALIALAILAVMAAARDGGGRGGGHRAPSPFVPGGHAHGHGIDTYHTHYVRPIGLDTDFWFWMWYWDRLDRRAQWDWAHGAPQYQYQHQGDAAQAAGGNRWVPFALGAAAAAPEKADEKPGRDGSGGGAGPSGGGGDGGDGGGDPDDPSAARRALHLPDRAPAVDDVDASASERADKKPNFMLDVFAFVFGGAAHEYADYGAGSHALEGRRALAVYDKIAECGGVVCAEQLAPFLDDILLKRSAGGRGGGTAAAATALFEQSARRLRRVLRLRRTEGSGSDDERAEDTSDGTGTLQEGYMLPVCRRFGGTPVATDDGVLAYIFPLVATASRATAGQGAPEPPPLLEKEWPHLAPRLHDREGRVALVAGLGAANVALLFAFSGIHASITSGKGARELSKLFVASVGAEGNQEAISDFEKLLVDFVNFVAWMLPALWAYALSFIVVPTARWLVREVLNRGVRHRNARRGPAAAEALAHAEAAEEVKGQALAFATRALARGNVV